VSASVTNGSAFYRCLAAHTSGTFATDLAAGKWVLIVDFATIALVAAAMIAVTPSGTLTSDAQTSFQVLDSGKAPTSHLHPSSAISDSTAAGRALLTAADATAQNVLLGTTSLGFGPGDIKETATLVLQTGWYWCDGSNKNRVTDANLFNAITIQQTGVLTSGSAVVTGLSDTTNAGNTPMSPGMPVSGTGIQSGTLIQSVDSATQVTLTKTATSSATTALVFAPFGVGDGSTTFGIPNRAYLAVGRDNASSSASNVTQVSTSISLTSGSTSATVGSTAGLAIGMGVSHPKLILGTTITAISGTTLTPSAGATATASGTARFSPLLDAQTLGAIGGSQTRGLTRSNLPNVVPTFTGSASALSITSTFTGTPNLAVIGLATGGSSTFAGGSQGIAGITGTVTSTGTTVAAGTVQDINGGVTQTAFITDPPKIVVNYIIKR
jgi:hypothetical protein